MEGINGTQIKLNQQIVVPTEIPLVAETGRIATYYTGGQMKVSQNGQYGVMTVNRATMGHTSTAAPPTLCTVQTFHPFSITGIPTEEAILETMKTYAKDRKSKKIFFFPFFSPLTKSCPKHSKNKKIK